MKKYILISTALFFVSSGQIIKDEILRPVEREVSTEIYGTEIGKEIQIATALENEEACYMQMKDTARIRKVYAEKLR